ncbi:sigma-70 family RNA polymerase sigma factor [Chitinophaga sp.]|uniref:RNA polymerase sigma factor n=1 Tax=Chitinophaga sp. TaxID=1869181 RepID=UPI0031DE26D9
MEDAEILQRLISRKPGAFEALHARYAKLLFARAYTILKNPQEAEEVVQSFFVHQLLPFRKWDRVGDLKAYLLRGIYHNCLIALSREKRMREKNQQFFTDEASAFPNTGEPVSMQPEMKSYETEMLYQVLASLTTQQQTAMRLLYIEGCRYHDIARIMNISVNSVKTHLRIARKSIQKYKALFQSMLSTLMIAYFFF